MYKFNQSSSLFYEFETNFVVLSFPTNLNQLFWYINILYPVLNVFINFNVFSVTSLFTKKYSGLGNHSVITVSFKPNIWQLLELAIVITIHLDLSKLVQLLVPISFE